MNQDQVNNLTTSAGLAWRLRRLDLAIRSRSVVHFTSTGAASTKKGKKKKKKEQVNDDNLIEEQAVSRNGTTQGEKKKRKRRRSSDIINNKEEGNEEVVLNGTGGGGGTEDLGEIYPRVIEFALSRLSPNKKETIEALENDMVARFGDNERAACRAAIGLLLTLGVLEKEPLDGLVHVCSKQIETVENIDHYTHAWFVLSDRASSLRAEANELEERVRVGMKQPLNETSSLLLHTDDPLLFGSSVLTTTTGGMSPVFIRTMRDQAVKRVRSIQIALARAGGVTALNEMFGGTIVVNEGPLGFHPGSPTILEHPPSMYEPKTVPQTRSSVQHYEVAMVDAKSGTLAPGFEVELATRPFDFSELASQFETWTGSSNDFSSSSASDGVVVSSFPGRSPRAISPRYHQHQDEQQHSWSRASSSAPMPERTPSPPTTNPTPVPPTPSPRFLGAPSTPSVRVPQWVYVTAFDPAAAPVVAVKSNGTTTHSVIVPAPSGLDNDKDSEEEEDEAAWKEEEGLIADDALLQRHDAALAEFKARYEAAEAERKKRKLEAREMRENAARVVAAARASSKGNVVAVAPHSSHGHGRGRSVGGGGEPTGDVKK